MARALDFGGGNMQVSCDRDAMPRILIADDNPDLIDALRLLLKGAGIEFDAVTSPEAALRALQSRAFDLVLMDLNYTGDTTSGREGIDLLARVQALDRLLPVIVMTGWGSVDLAVEAMRRGARDFVQKPDTALLSTRARRLGRTPLPSVDAASAANSAHSAAAPAPQIDGYEIAPGAGIGRRRRAVSRFGESRLALTIADVVGKASRRA